MAAFICALLAASPPRAGAACLCDGARDRGAASSRAAPGAVGAQHSQVLACHHRGPAGPWRCFSSSAPALQPPLRPPVPTAGVTSPHWFCSPCPLLAAQALSPDLWAQLRASHSLAHAASAPHIISFSVTSPSSVLLEGQGTPNAGILSLGKTWCDGSAASVLCPHHRRWGREDRSWLLSPCTPRQRGIPGPSGAVSVEFLSTRHSLQAGPCGIRHCVSLPRPLQFTLGACSSRMPWHGWWLSTVL